MKDTKKKSFSVRLRNASVPMLPAVVMYVWINYGIDQVSWMLPGALWTFVCWVVLPVVLVGASHFLVQDIKMYMSSEKQDGSHERL